jgi:hypothetical protein
MRRDRVHRAGRDAHAVAHRDHDFTLDDGERLKFVFDGPARGLVGVGHRRALLRSERNCGRAHRGRNYENAERSP